MLPYLQSYNDPKVDRAYRRFLAGESQRKLAKTLRIPLRTLNRIAVADGWRAEREARKVASQAGGVATAVASVATESTTSSVADATKAESRTVGMDRMLRAQQGFCSRLVEALNQDASRTFEEAEKSGRPVTRSQIAQLASLGERLLTMQRKAWCVPDKIETKDTTPTPEDKVRKLSDDELDRELAREEGIAAATATGEEPAPSVN